MAGAEGPEQEEKALNDSPPILAYSPPARSLWVRMLERIPVYLIAVFNPTAAVLAIWWMILTIKSHNSSFGGCATGRLHGLDLLMFAVLPVCTIALSHIAANVETGFLVRLARYGMLAAVSAYAVLLLDVFGLLEVLKYDVLRMR